MTILFQAAAKNYSPSVTSFAFNLAAPCNRISVTLTRNSWPSGPVGRVRVNYPNGSLAIETTFNGGVESSPLTGPVTTSGADVYPPQGQSQCPAGAYACDVEVLQTLNTAIKVESF